MVGMLEAVAGEMNGGYGQTQQSCGESSEEELSVLPRHTKVVVTGNNRTNSVLVGLQGVVKKAVGLGGWHWLVILRDCCPKWGFFEIFVGRWLWGVNLDSVFFFYSFLNKIFKKRNFGVLMF